MHILAHLHYGTAGEDGALTDYGGHGCHGHLVEDTDGVGV